MVDFLTRRAAIGAAAVAAIFGLAMPQAHADDGQDQTFARLLAHVGVLFNFPLEKTEGQFACEELRDGDTQLSAIYHLRNNGSYSFDVANAIVSAANVAYCPEVPPKVEPPWEQY